MPSTSGRTFNLLQCVKSVMHCRQPSGHPCTAALAPQVITQKVVRKQDW